MGQKNNTIKLFAAQSRAVRDIIDSEGVCYSRRVFVEKKYGDSAKIFLTAYDWMAKNMAKYVPKPENAEYPYWLYGESYSASPEAGELMKLDVPLDEAVFFDVYDWNKVLSLKYIGENERDEREFAALLREYGMNETQVMLTNFYPDLKRQITMSWQRLFRHHEAIKKGENHSAKAVQAAVWHIRKEWME